MGRLRLNWRELRERRGVVGDKFVRRAGVNGPLQGTGGDGAKFSRRCQPFISCSFLLNLTLFLSHTIIGSVAEPFQLSHALGLPSARSQMHFQISRLKIEGATPM